MILDAQMLAGERNIALPGRAAFGDPYERFGYGIDAHFLRDRLDLSLQQWLGYDGDADGARNALGSSGGYARLKYYVTPHFYSAVRLDAAANPFVKRTLLLYGGALVGKHARIVVEHRINLLGGTAATGAYLTIAGPWPAGL